MTGLWQWKPGPPKRYQTSATDLHAITRGDRGTPLIALHDRLEQLVHGRLVPHSIPGDAREFNPTHFLRDRNGGLWIGTPNHGLLLVQQGRTDRFSRSDGLSGDDVTALYEDREGSIWIATSEGLDRFRDFAIPAISAAPGSPPINAGAVLAAQDGSVWVGTYNGANRWKNGQRTIYTTKDGLPDDDVESLFQDDRGRIWVATPGGVVWFENGRFVSGNVPPGGYVHAIVQDSRGDLWFNQDQGLVRLMGGGQVERIPLSHLGQNADPWSLIPDPGRGGLWLGFVDRMAYLKDGDIKASYTKADGLGSGRVADLHIDNDGTVWAATDGGLSRLKDGRITTLTSGNGLPCDSVHWALEDDNHSVWLYMACGLARIARADLDAWAANPKGKVRATLFDVSDGVRGIAGPGSAYQPRVAKVKDGRVWFVGAGDLYVIDPHYLAFNKLPPPVHVEQIIADRKTHDAYSNLRLQRLLATWRSTTRRSASSRRRRTVFASNWKAAIPNGRTLATNGRRSITIFLRAITVSA
jgi:ligand-binding sensor domain-containing protein